MLKCHRHCVNP